MCLGALKKVSYKSKAHTEKAQWLLNIIKDFNLFYINLYHKMSTSKD